MRRALPLLIALCLTLGAFGSPAPVEAEPRRSGKAIARAHPTGGDAVYVARRLLWKAASSRERIVTELRWSRQRDALAFATTNRVGAMTLVVVLIGGFTDGHVMTWPIPRVGPTTTPIVTWLGRRRVAVGRSELRPEVVASWRVRQ